MSDQALLHELARRVRAARLDRGLTVSELARRTGLSRRFLTEAEAGRANPSLVSLGRLARELGLPLGKLCDLPLRATGERFALVGLRGAGKSTLGRALARELEAPFVELDQRIEALAGLSLAEVFDLHGPDYFHELEGEALEEVLAEGGRLVLAAGGSIVDSPKNFARLCSRCRTVWLSASPDEHFERVVAQGDRRPMRGRPQAMEELRSLLARRGDAYARCELHVDTSGRTAEECLAELVASCRA